MLLSLSKAAQKVGICPLRNIRFLHNKQFSNFPQNSRYIRNNCTVIWTGDLFGEHLSPDAMSSPLKPQISRATVYVFVFLFITFEQFNLHTMRNEMLLYNVTASGLSLLVIFFTICYYLTLVISSIVVETLNSIFL